MLRRVKPKVQFQGEFRVLKKIISELAANMESGYIYDYDLTLVKLFKGVCFLQGLIRNKFITDC